VEFDWSSTADGAYTIRVLDRPMVDLMREHWDD
jgi:hypothetical protein